MLHQTPPFSLQPPHPHYCHFPHSPIKSRSRDNCLVHGLICEYYRSKVSQSLTSKCQNILRFWDRGDFKLGFLPKC